MFPQVEAVEHLHGAFAPQAQLHTEVGREGGVVQQIGFDGRVLCVEVEAENAGQHQCPQALQYALFGSYVLSFVGVLRAFVLRARYPYKISYKITNLSRFVKAADVAK